MSERNIGEKWSETISEEEDIIVDSSIPNSWSKSVREIESSKNKSECGESEESPPQESPQNLGEDLGYLGYHLPPADPMNFQSSPNPPFLLSPHINPLSPYIYQQYLSHAPSSIAPLQFPTPRYPNIFNPSASSIAKREQLPFELMANCRMRIPLPSRWIGEHVVYVNAKQYSRIVKMREKKMQRNGGRYGHKDQHVHNGVWGKRTYRHQSRHLLAVNRVREKNGRFKLKEGSALKGNQNENIHIDRNQNIYMGKNISNNHSPHPPDQPPDQPLPDPPLDFPPADTLTECGVTNKGDGSEDIQDKNEFLATQSLMKISTIKSYSANPTYSDLQIN